ncbi:MAG TPA: XRE family transcriptional regulator [Thermoanaerobaculia bacterium]|nr:XRE family transcriptional regulator [Thermoanaerobaculia bacterium]
MKAPKLGARIRELRQQRRLTLEELAEQSSVSRAMLSKLERGEKNPTLVVAAKIASALRVSLTAFLGVEEARKTVVIVPKDRRMTFRDPETGFERQLLSPTFESRTIEFVRHVIPPGARSGELPPYRKGTEKHLVVEQGKLTVTIGDDEYRLSAGDALYFEADTPHQFANGGRGTCSYYLVISARTS